MNTNTVERETETDRVLRFLTSHQASRIPSWLQIETDTKRQSERKTEGEVREKDKEKGSIHTLHWLHLHSFSRHPSCQKAAPCFAVTSLFCRSRRRHSSCALSSSSQLLSPAPSSVFNRFAGGCNHRHSSVVWTRKLTQGNSKQHCRTYSAALGLAVTTSHSHSYTLALQGWQKTAPKSSAIARLMS